MISGRKRWYRSKTIWFNLIMAGLGVAEINAKLIQPHVDGNVYAWGFYVLTIGNAMLRTLTNLGVSK